MRGRVGGFEVDDEGCGESGSSGAGCRAEQGPFWLWTDPCPCQASAAAWHGKLSNWPWQAKPSPTRVFLEFRFFRPADDIANISQVLTAARRDPTASIAQSKIYSEPQVPAHGFLPARGLAGGSWLALHPHRRKGESIPGRLHPARLGISPVRCFHSEYVTRIPNLADLLLTTRTQTVQS